MLGGIIVVVFVCCCGWVLFVCFVFYRHGSDPELSLEQWGEVLSPAGELFLHAGSITNEGIHSCRG